MMPTIGLTVLCAIATDIFYAAWREIMCPWWLDLGQAEAAKGGV